MRTATTSSSARVLLVLAALCAVAAVWLSFDRPTVAGTAGGGVVTCAAPWDTALNGEAPNAGGDVGAALNDCYEAGALRFQLAVTAGAVGFFVLVGAGYAARRARVQPEAAPARQERRTAIPG